MNTKVFPRRTQAQSEHDARARSTRAAAALVRQFLDNTANAAQDGTRERWGTLRSAHATGGKVFPSALAYVLTRDGARIVAGRDARLGAVDALRRNAATAERGDGQRDRQDRRAA